MCFGPKDNSAAIAAQQERERQDAINSGISRVDKTFGGFNDSYFDTIKQDALDFYMPQLDDQYKDARRKTVLYLDKKGNLNSSAGIRKLRELDEARNTHQQTIADRALSIAQDQRGRIESAKSDLYSQIYAGADPAGAGATAASRAASLQAPPQFGPLGDLFTNFTNFAANGITAEKYGYPGFNTGLFQSGTNTKGSSKVVGV